MKKHVDIAFFLNRFKPMKMKKILRSSLSWMSKVSQWLILARKRTDIALHTEIPLLRLFIAVFVIFLVASVLKLGFSQQPKMGEFLVELTSIVFAAIGVFEISDGVVLSSEDRSLLIDAAKGKRELEAKKRIPALLVEASDKCKIGLVFVLFGWVLDWLLRFHLIEQILEFSTVSLPKIFQG